MSKLREWRISKGVKLQSVAAALGVTRQTYASYEDNPERMSVQQAQAVCSYLGCTMDDIFVLNKVN